MDGLYEGPHLGPALRDARERSLAIYGHLHESQWTVPYLAIINPPLWELAHVAWFQELWCLRHRDGQPIASRGPSMLAGADALLDSSLVPHRDRWTLAFPPRDAIFEYIHGSHEATLEALEGAPEAQRYFFELALLHEDMHGEAMVMTLQTLGLPAPEGLPVAPPPSPQLPAGDVAFRGGTFRMGGARPRKAFVFDNECDAHEVTVQPFAMARAPVSQGEYARYVEDGDDGQVAARTPRHWRRAQRGWEVRRFDRWVDLDPAAPMIHASLEMAQAWCAWAGRRLPTESEWEFAALQGEPGLERLFGSVWQWTSSPFAPYPGFRPGPYKDYSQPWFDTHCVLRGSSFATRSRLSHPRWRNFYLPGRDDAFAGFRTCAVPEVGS
jgi:iron(II)-dependent oxidoreductase